MKWRHLSTEAGRDLTKKINRVYHINIAPRVYSLPPFSLRVLIRLNCLPQFRTKSLSLSLSRFFLLLEVAEIWVRRGSLHRRSQGGWVIKRPLLACLFTFYHCFRADLLLLLCYLCSILFVDLVLQLWSIIIEFNCLRFRIVGCFGSLWPYSHGTSQLFCPKEFHWAWGKKLIFPLDAVLSPCIHVFMQAQTPS